MNNRFAFLTTLYRATVLMLLLGLSGIVQAAGPVLDGVVERGVLRVAMSGNQQPFNFVYGKHDAVIGFDVDLAEQLAKLIEVELEIVKLPFGQLIGALESGRADMIISGMTITAARTRNVTFVGPYMLSGKSMLATPRTAAQLKSEGGLDSPDIRLVALDGSTSEALIRRDMPKVSLVKVEDYDAGLKLLFGGQASGMVADLPILAMANQRNREAGLVLVRPPLSIEPLGIVIARGDDQLENLLRNYLAVFEKTGLLLDLHKKWFEVGNSNIYGP